MAIMNVSDADFETVARAAWAAKEQGDEAEAEELDKIARKINAALTQQQKMGRRLKGIFREVKPLRWGDVPSVFDVGR
jgi:hypothetical protein